jgi:predicted TIM-barrel fold metal-dependent hydrolase
VRRREFLAGAAVFGLQAQPAPIPIIDTHIHLFDPTRPQGVPWPEKGNAALYRPALPERYRKPAGPLGIVGAIEVEASPWVEDNLWVLEVAARNTFVVATVGNLEPGKPEFGEYLERYRRNPLFRGIRYGNLWGRDLAMEVAKPEFVEGLKLLAQAGLTLDTANPRPSLIEAALRVTDRVADLRVVMDHLPSLDPPPGAAGVAYYNSLRELAKRPRVYAKLSGIVRRVNGRVPADAAFYRDRLDPLCELFGEDRVLFGSDWPNCDNVAPIETAVAIVKEYFAGKGRVAAEKYFWRNSVAAYGWTPREPTQPGAAA